MPVSMLSTSLLSDKRSYSRFNALDTIYTPPAPPPPGMVLIKPTSIDYSGTSATLGENGQVTFSAVTSLSLNGVFSADFDNYQIHWSGAATTGVVTIQYRLRASGSDASGSDYTFQRLEANATSVAAARSTSQSAVTVNFLDTGNTLTVLDVYGPALAQPTASRSVSAVSYLTTQPWIYDVAGTHSLSTAYDGITFLRNTAAMTGTVSVYGIRS